jgi:hypothetical protein
MDAQRSLGIACVVAVLCGCASTNDATQSWRQMTSAPEKRREQVAELRQWTCAIPSNLQRSELVDVELPAPAIEAFVPQAADTSVRRASWAPGSANPYTIRQIGGVSIRNLSDLEWAVEEQPDDAQRLRVSLSRNPISADNTVSMDCSLPILRALRQAATPSSRVLRLDQNGQTVAIIREDGIRCKLDVRVERNSGLVQLILELNSYWGNPALSPKDVSVDCQNVPLRCLSVAESLELLYGDQKSILKKPELKAAHFESVAAREDFLVPGNFRRLQAAFERQYEPGMALQLQPGLISVAGRPYPGSPVLGDARALTSYSLQSGTVYPGGEPRYGWVMFAGADVKKSSRLDVHVDLTGNKPITLSYAIPAS